MLLLLQDGINYRPANMSDKALFYYAMQLGWEACMRHRKLPSMKNHLKIVQNFKQYP